MDGLFLLVGLAYVPVPLEARYAEAFGAARKAAFIQSGLQADWDTVLHGAEQAAPPLLRQVAPVAAALYKREVELNSKALRLNLKSGEAKALLTLEW